MQYHYGFVQRKAYPANISHRYLALWKPNIAEQMNNLRKKRKFKTICVNDVGLTQDREDEVNERVRSFLENYYPKKSSFEL